MDNFSLQHQYKIKQTSDENIEKYQKGDYELIHDQILNPKMIGNVWQRVRRISNEILGVTGLNIFVCFL